MKYLKQFRWIMLVTCVGEIMKFFIPLPIPASIYGLLIMMLLLVSRIIDVDDVKDVGGFLIEIMPLMFIPAAVGIIISWEQLKKILIPILIIIVISTFLVMVISGRVTQFMITREKKDE